ncbi:MAG TPA: hypothetical protein VIX80_03120 [Candidatus Kapabacteria bacterium]
MKKLTSLISLALVALMLCISSKGFAQGTDATPTTTAAPFKPFFGVGPFFTAGAAVFTGDVPEGLKTGMQFAYTAGAIGTFELSKTFGITLGLGYQSRPIYFRNEESAEFGETTANLTYISIQPGIKFGAFMIGVDINMPNAATASYKVTKPIEGSSETDIDNDDLGTVIDFRIGGLIPITQSTTSELNFFVQAAYGLTSAIKNEKKLDGTEMTYPVGTLQGGLCYTFFLGR